MRLLSVCVADHEKYVWLKVADQIPEKSAGVLLPVEPLVPPPPPPPPQPASKSVTINIILLKIESELRAFLVMFMIVYFL